MFKQEQILIEDSPFINDKSSYIDIDKAKRILCAKRLQILDNAVCSCYSPRIDQPQHIHV